MISHLEFGYNLYLGGSKISIQHHCFFVINQKEVALDITTRNINNIKVIYYIFDCHILDKI